MSVQLLLQHLQEAPTPPSHRTERPIPKAVDDLVLACLQKDPARRLASVDEVLRRATISTPGQVWDEEAAREWWQTHLPDQGDGSDLTSGSITSDPGVEPHRGSIWIVLPWH